MNQDLDYLEADDIGGVISKGLAVLYLEQPKFPIDFLAKWLLNYARNQKIKNEFEKDEKKRIALQEKHKKEIDEAEKKKERLQQEALSKKQVEEQFREKIVAHHYHDEFLQKDYCNFLKNQKNFTGVYVCELDFPSKVFNPELEDDEQSHIDPSGTKLLRYVAASQNQSFIIGRTLQPETGVTYEVLKEALPNDEGIVVEQKGIYVPDVVKDSRIVYHQWPKLGAFYAVPLVYNCVLNEAAFDQAVENRQTYLVAKENQRREIEAKQQEFEEALQGKQEGEDTQQLEQEFQAYKDGLEEVKEAAFQSVKREFVVCVDTLDQDREINEEDRNYVYEYTQLVARSWEDREKQALSDDIDRQLKYLEGLQNSAKEMVEQFQQEEEAYVEANCEKFEELKEKNQLEYQYEVDSLRYEKLKEQLSDRNFTQPLLNLAENRLIKFPGIIQAAFYLLGFDKQDINLPGTNILNWKYVRTLLNDTFIDKVLAYSYKGPKNSIPFKWSLVNRVQKRLEKFEQEPVDFYCIAYGRLLKMKMDIEVRRFKIQQKRHLIEQLKEEVIKIQEEREKQLQAEKEALSPEDQETFVQEEWDAAFYSEHPLPEIPENPEDEIDADYEFEQQ